VNVLALKIADIGIRVTSAVAVKGFNDFGFYKNFWPKELLPPNAAWNTTSAPRQSSGMRMPFSNSKLAVIILGQ